MVDSQDNGVTQQLVQRLLTRMDFREFRLLREQRSDLQDHDEQLQDMREVIGEFKRARARGPRLTGR